VIGDDGGISTKLIYQTDINEHNLIREFSPF